MKKYLLLLCALVCGTFAFAQTESSWTAPEAPASELKSGTKYYLYNVGAGEFLVNGTLQMASIGEQGLAATVSQVQEESSWTIQFDSFSQGSLTSYENPYLYYENGALRCTHEGTPDESCYFTITAVDGQEKTYTIVSAQAEEGMYVGWDGEGSTEVSPLIEEVGENTYWQFITPDDYEEGYELYVARKNLYDALVEAEELKLTNYDAYTNAGEVYESEESTVEDLEEALEALVLLIDGVDSDYHAGDIVSVSGTRYELQTDNAVENHSFEFGFEGWTDYDLKTLTHDDFELRTDGAQHESHYLVSTNSRGALSGSGAICTAWAIEAGKTYYFSYYIKSLTGETSTSTTNLNTSLANTPGTVAETLGHPESVSSNWQKVEYVFTNGEEGEDDCYSYVQVMFSSLTSSNWGFDNFQLYEVEADEAEYEYNITSLLANPSFEEDDVADLEADSDRGYSVTELTGWELDGPNGDNAHKDIMTAESSATDNNYGVPGDPSDGTQMLYLRDAWAANTGSVMQSVVLPAGDYKLTVDTKCAAGDPTKHSASLVVGKESKALTIHAKGTPTSETAEEPFVDEWDTAVFEFILTEPTEVSMGVQISFGGEQYGLAVILDNFQLFSTEEVEAVEYANDVTWALANPSFEVDNVVANLTADETRGSYKVTSLTGWDLVAPTHQNSSYPVSDLMTAESTATDNNFGVPGDPADGTYMLYLRDANVQQNEGHLDDASVMQTVTLPAGDYKLTVDSKCVATDANAGTVTLVAGEHSKALTIHTDSKVPEGWDNALLVFSLTTEAEVTVGVNIEFTDASTNYPLSVLLDNFKLYSVEEIEKTISWTMTDAGWGTMILPFAATLEEGLTAYSCDGTTTDEETETTTVDLTEVGQTITANTPYVIKCTDEDAVKAHSFTGTPTNTVETYTAGIITGTLVDLAIAKGAALTIDGTNYVLQNHTDDGEGLAFYPITEASEGVTLDAYHCYLDLSLVTTSARPVALHFPGAGETTAIVAVESDDLIANDAIYDLSGRRVAKAVKGVYIQNGKKVLVK